MSDEMDKLLEVLHGLKMNLNSVQEKRQPLLDEIKIQRDRERQLQEEIRKASQKRFEFEGELYNVDVALANLPKEIKELELKINALRLKKLERERLDRAISAIESMTLEAKWRLENRSDGLGAKQHQIDGAFQLALAGGGYLFDKRGLGKSLTSLITADFKESKKLIIITPNEVASEFVKQIALWTNRTIIPFYQQDAIERQIWFNLLERTNEFAIVINIEAWRKDPTVIDSLVKLQPDTVIVDEAHLINKTELKAWQGIWRLVRGTPNQCPTCGHVDIMVSKDTKQVLCKLCGQAGQWYNDKYVKSQYDWLSVKTPVVMTGTPILNRPQDLYPLLRLIQPDVFYNEAEYTRNYTYHVVGTRYKWLPRGREQLYDLMGDKLVMRDRKSAGVEIPDQQIIIHELQLDPQVYPRQAAALHQIKNYAQLVMNEAGDTMNIQAFITLLLRMRQGIVWPAGITLKHKRYDEILDREVVVSEQQLEVYESIKLDWIVEHIKQDVEDGERILVFSQFNPPLYELQNRLIEAGISCAVYNGETPKWKCEDIKNDFDPQALKGKEPKYQVALIQYRKGGTGLNMQAATITYVCDEEWNPGKADQAFGRNDRMGQTRQTQVHIPRVTNSVGDMFMAKLMDEKGELVGDFESGAMMMRRFKSALDDKGMM